jgi:hypothetical protein
MGCKLVKQNARFARLLQGSEGSEGRLCISEGFGRLTTIRRPAKVAKVERLNAKVAKFWALLRIEIMCSFCAIFLKEGRVDP